MHVYNCYDEPKGDIALFMLFCFVSFFFLVFVGIAVYYFSVQLWCTRNVSVETVCLNVDVWKSNMLHAAVSKSNVFSDLKIWDRILYFYQLPFGSV